MSQTCTRPNCERAVLWAGLCQGHYKKHYEAGRTRRVEAGPVRAHVRTLLDAGWTHREIREEAGVSGDVIHRLTTQEGASKRGPQATVWRSTAEALLALRPDTPGRGTGRHAKVSVLGTRRRIRALARIGWPLAEQSRLIGLHVSTKRNGDSMLLHINNRRSDVVSVATARAVADLYDKLSMTPGPSRLSMFHAQRQGWAPPLAWNDEDLDDPSARPDYYGRRVKIDTTEQEGTRDVRGGTPGGTRNDPAGPA